MTFAQGQNLILNMNDKGFNVVAYNRTTSKVDHFLENEAKGETPRLDSLTNCSLLNISQILQALEFKEPTASKSSLTSSRNLAKLSSS